MIIQCDKCKARFKLADEKVSAKGVRVRCTKCQHTFVVRQSIDEQVAAAKAQKDEAEAAAAAALAALVAAPPPARPTSELQAQSERAAAAEPPPPAAPPSAPAAAQPPTAGPPPSLDDMFGAPTADPAGEAPAPTPGLFDGPPPDATVGADPDQAKALFGDFDLDGDPPGTGADALADPGIASEGEMDSALSDLNFGGADTYDPPLPGGGTYDPPLPGVPAGAAAAPDFAPPAGADPSPPPESPLPGATDLDAVFGTGPAAAGAAAEPSLSFEADPAPGPAEPSFSLGADPAPGPAEPSLSFDADPAPGPAGNPGGGLGTAAGVASDAEAKEAIDAAASLDLDAAFGVSAADDAGGDALSSEPEPPADDDGGWSFDFGAATADDGEAAGEGEASGLETAGADAGFEDWQIDNSEGPAPHEFDPGAFTGGDAEGGGLELEGPPSTDLLAQTDGGSDPFATLDLAGGAPEFDAAGGDLGGGFEAPADEFPQGAVLGTPASPGPTAAASASGAGASTGVVIGVMGQPRKQSTPAPTPMPVEKAGIGSLVMNGVFVAALLAAGLGVFVASRTDGAIDGSLFSPARISQALGGGDRGLEVVSTIPGAYPRAEGGALVYVRGVLYNASAGPVPRPKIEARLIAPTGDFLGTAEGVVGAEPSAAELHGLADLNELEALLERLGQEAGSELPPGASLPYFAVFLSAPADARSGLRFEVRPVTTP